MSARTDLEARLQAVTAGGQSGDWRAVEAALGDGRWEVRREALRCLREHGRDDWPTRAVAALDDRSERLQRFAADVLRQAGQEAVPALAAGLDDPVRGPWCAGVLACSLPGRAVLRGLPEAGCELLVAAAHTEGMAISPHLVNVAKALVLCEPDAAADCLAEMVARGGILLYTAGRALYLMGDPRALPWALDRLRRSYVVDRELVTWIGAYGGAAALPALRRLCGFWNRMWITRGVRQAAREAIERIEAQLAHVPSAALSIAPRPTTGPSEAALSFWASEDEAG